MTEIEIQAEGVLATCFREVQALCSHRGLNPIRVSTARKGYLGVQLQGATSLWTLDIDCEWESQTRLPSVWLRPPNPLMAHVGYYGSVCVNDAQGLSFDPDRRTEIVAYTVLAAFDLLEKSATDAACGMVEFYNELEGYWLCLPESCKSRAAVAVDGRDRLVSVYVNSKSKTPKWYFTERNAPAPAEFYIKELAAQRALYVHIEAPIEPPSYPSKLDAKFVDAVHRRLSPAQLELWDQLVGPSKNGPRLLGLLVSVPRPSGGLSLIGMSFSARTGQIDMKGKVTPLTVRRHTAAYMRERGGASLDLYGKHVVVFGCGAVGSEVADSLAAAGVGHLTLVDHDDYSEDNVFRHVLDPLWIDSPKVEGLKYQLERRYPGLSVTAVPDPAQVWLAKHDLGDVDGVVLALGLPTLDRLFGRRLRQTAKLVPLAFTWLEPLDIGGHSILVWTHGAGCLDCLYRDEEGQAVQYPRTSFMEPNQHVSRNLTGCSSVFVPFGALQARRTALMAAEHMLGALSGAQEPSYRFWVGDGRTALAQDLRTTAWWHEAPSTTVSDATRRVFGRNCRRCKGSV